MNAGAPARPVVRPRGSRWRWWLSGLFIALLFAFDWSREPARQITTGAELAAIRRYQVWISPWLQKGGVRCRFNPSCSHYAAAVLSRDGFITGNFRALGRVLRCGPWTSAGTSDPP